MQKNEIQTKKPKYREKEAPNRGAPHSSPGHACFWGVTIMETSVGNFSGFLLRPLGVLVCAACFIRLSSFKREIWSFFSSILSRTLTALLATAAGFLGLASSSLAGSGRDLTPAFIWLTSFTSLSRCSFMCISWAFSSVRKFDVDLDLPMPPTFPKQIAFNGLFFGEIVLIKK